MRLTSSSFACKKCCLLVKFQCLDSIHKFQQLQNLLAGASLQNRIVFLLKHRLAKEIIQKLIEEIHFFYRRQEFKIITRQNGSLILNMTGHSIVQSFSFSLRKITNNQQKMTWFFFWTIINDRLSIRPKTWPKWCPNDATHNTSQLFFIYFFRLEKTRFNKNAQKKRDWRVCWFFEPKKLNIFWANMCMIF